MKILKNLAKVSAIIILVALNTGCSKPENLLTKEAWTFEEITHTSDNDLTIAFLAISEAFLEGATLEFVEDGSYIITSPDSDNPSTGTWELVGDDQLTLNPDGEEGEDETTILELTNSKLVYTESEVDLGLNAYTITTTWVR